MEYVIPELLPKKSYIESGKDWRDFYSRICRIPAGLFDVVIWRSNFNDVLPSERYVGIHSVFDTLLIAETLEQMQAQIDERTKKHIW